MSVFGIIGFAVGLALLWGWVCNGCCGGCVVLWGLLCFCFFFGVVFGFAVVFLEGFFFIHWSCSGGSGDIFFFFFPTPALQFCCGGTEGIFLDTGLCSGFGFGVVVLKGFFY